MKLLGIDHIQLAIPAGKEDLGRAFYSGVLGFTEVAKPTELADSNGAWFETGSIKLHLGIDPNFTPATKAHPAMLVDDLESLVKLLETRDVPYSAGVAINGQARIFVNDPYGNRLEFMQSLSVN